MGKGSGEGAGRLAEGVRARSGVCAGLRGDGEGRGGLRWRRAGVWVFEARGRLKRSGGVTAGGGGEMVEFAWEMRPKCWVEGWENRAETRNGASQGTAYSGRAMVLLW